MSVFIPVTAPASTDAIVDLEKELGLNLPKSYVLFLKDHDGAKPENNSFKLDKGNNSSVDRFIPLHESIRVRNIVEGFPRNVIPIAYASCGNLVYISPQSGAVYFWNHEDNSADVKLADSFDAFLAALERFNADQIKLEPGQVKKVWVSPD